MDGEGSVNDRSELLSPFVVTILFYAKIDLITVVYLLVVSAKTFVEVVLLECLCSLECVLSVVS